MRVRVAMVHGPGDPRHDGVGDYVAHLVDALPAHGVDVRPVPVRPHGRGGWAAGVVAAARQVRRLRPDVVHVQFAPSAYRFSPVPGTLPLLVPRGTPLVTTVHEYGWWAAPSWVPAAAWTRLERGRRWDRETGLLVLRSALVIVTNAGHAQQVQARTGARTVEIPLAANVAVHASTDAPGAVRAAVRARLGLAPDAHLLAFFGFVHPVKGVRYAIEALPALRARRPGLHLLVVGGFTSQALPEAEAAAFRAELTGLAQDRGVADAVTFTGHVPAPEVSRLLQAADVAVLPFTAGVTLKSGALLAVLAHGLPTAVTRPEPPEGDPDPALVDGRTVAVIPARRDAAAVASTVGRLLDDAELRQRLAAAGPALVRDRSWPRVAAAHATAYAEVAGAAGVAGSEAGAGDKPARDGVAR